MSSLVPLSWNSYAQQWHVNTTMQQVVIGYMVPVSKKSPWLDYMLNMVVGKKLLKQRLTIFISSLEK